MDAMIIDDTQTAIDELSAKLEKYAEVSIVATASNGTEGMEKLKKYKPELVFLDMEMPDMTGIDFLNRMRDETEHWCYVVIYTAYNDYVLPSFRNKAFDFLLKPVDDNELDTIMKRFFDDRQRGGRGPEEAPAVRRNCDKLLFYTNAVDFRLVQVRDICVFGYDSEARVWTATAAGYDRPMRLKRSVNKEVLLRLDDCFVQVSQKYIININYLLEVNDNICSFYPPFEGIDYVKVGRFYRRKLVNLYNSL